MKRTIHPKLTTQIIKKISLLCAMLFALISMKELNLMAQSDLDKNAGKHYLSRREVRKLRVLRAKIQNAVDKIYRQINVLKTLKDSHAKTEEIESLSVRISGDIENLIDEINDY